MPVQKSRLVATADINRIVQGESLTITVELFDSITRQALDLTDATAATATFPATDTESPVAITLGSGVELDTGAGRVAITIDEASTALLRIGEAQSWQVEVTLADGSIRIAQLEEALDVVASLF